jgi:lysozyme
LGNNVFHPVKISAAGLKLIKEFEGLRLTAYICPAGVLTIGYGSAGPHVTPGKAITRAQADALLLKDLARFEAGVSELITKPLTQGQFDALVSFAFNLGCGALEESTLRRRLNGGEDANTVIAQELPKWVKAAGATLPGLVRRRAAEVELATSGGAAPAAAATVTIKAMQTTLLKKRAINGDQLAENEKATVEAGKTYAGCKVLGQDGMHTLLELPGGAGQWYVFPSHWEGFQPKPGGGGRVLAVKYQSQRDNKTSGADNANRTCFSSSCAMLAMTVKPGSVANDDDYIQKRQPFGDSTDANVQVACLRSLGINARFTVLANNATIQKQIDRGIPVPVGILHKGTATNPSGQGHWICVIGYDAKGFVVHDPWGEIDHASGTYINANGASLHYSYRLFDSRWTVSGGSDGWAVLVD